MSAVAVAGLKLRESCTEEEPKIPLPGEFWLDVTSTSGHEHLVWNKRLVQDMKEAQKKFYELLEKGYKLFCVRADGKKDERPLLRFDPLAEHVVAVAPIRGG